MRASLFLLTAWAAFAQCQPSELLTQLQNLPDLSTEETTYKEIVEQRRALLAQHPESILAERGLIAVIQNGWWAEADRQRERARYRAMPDRKLSEFLEAALQLLYYDQRQLSQRFPDLAPQLCVAPIVSFNQLRNPQTRAAAIPVAIKALGDRTDNDAVIGWSEVIDAMHQEHDPGLAAAVAKLRGMNRYQNNYWANAAVRTLGYLGDEKEVARLKADLAARRPDSSWGIEAELAAWKTAHPQPKDTSEASFALYAREFKRQLQQQHPRSARAAYYYFQAVKYGSSPELTAADAQTVAGLELRYDRDYPFGMFRQEEVPLQAARAYLAHGVRLDAIPNLAAEEVRRKRIEYELARPWAGTAQQANEQLERAELHADTVLAEYWSHRRDSAQAQNFAERSRGVLAQLVPESDAKGYPRQMFEREQAQWMTSMKSLGIETKPLAEPRVVNWEAVPRTPFPAFSVTDLQGRHWDLNAWKGKVVFLNVWGTWCVPCRAELPNIEKLYEETKTQSDMLVLTVNVDGDLDLTRKFMTDHNYKFPVVASPQLADLIDHTTSIPQSRFVDPEARILNEPADIRCASCEAAVRTVMQKLVRK